MEANQNEEVKRLEEIKKNTQSLVVKKAIQRKIDALKDDKGIKK